MLPTCLQFGGAVSDRVECGTLGGVTPTSFSLMAWIQITTFTNNRVIASKLSNAGVTPGWLWRISNSSEHSFFWHNIIGSDYITYVSSGAGLVVNTPYCLAIVVDVNAGAGLRVLLYAGDLKRPMTLLTTSVVNDAVGVISDPSAETFIIGNRSNNATTFLGQEWAVQYVENRAVRVEELETWRTSQPVLPNSRGQWRPGREGGIYVRDDSANGYTGTITGALPLSLDLPIGQPPRRKYAIVSAATAKPWLYYARQRVA